MTARYSLTLLIAFGAFSCGLYSCKSRPPDIPQQYRNTITHVSAPVEYREVFPFIGRVKKEIPSCISHQEALEDVQMLQYLLSTAYAGFEYWERRGIDFNAYFADMIDFVNEKDTVYTDELEDRLSTILKQLYDGHIALIGSRYNDAYRHKAAYYSDIVVVKAADGLCTVIDSQTDPVNVGDLFTQEDGGEYLFRTLSPRGKNHYLIGVLSFDAVAFRDLSFNSKTMRVPFHKSRLLYARFDDPEPFSIKRENNIPVVRVTSFDDFLYPKMKNFMESGNALRKENTIVVNLFGNGGGTSVFPQTFIQNLNGKTYWDLHSAVLTSPAITAYYAGFNLDSVPNLSPTFRNLIIANSNKFESYRRSPMTSWTFGSNLDEGIPAGYDGTLILLINRRVLSAGEGMVGVSQSVRNRITIGENTGGVVLFSDACQYYLPHSKLVAKLPRQLLVVPGFEECVGYLPDYWLDTMDPLKEVLMWRGNPDSYRFRYTNSYADMLKQNNLAPVLPTDVHIVSPSSRVPRNLRAFSGKWFGVTEGVLDQVLVVEHINDKLEASAIHSQGVAYQWGIERPSWQRYKGRFEGQKLILTDEGQRIRITYERNPDGNLDGTYERPGVFSRTTLARLGK